MFHGAMDVTVICSRSCVCKIAFDAEALMTISHFRILGPLKILETFK